MAGEKQSGVTLDPYQIILRPLVTEKGTHLSERYNSYTFVVNSKATKTDIKKAVEELWSVKVKHVRTQNRRGKPRRHQTSYGYTNSWKKAIVTLEADYKLELFDNA